MNYVEIQEEFKELLEYTQGLNDAINPKSQEIKGVCDAYSGIKPEDFVKSNIKNEDTHPQNDEINIKSDKINPVFDDSNWNRKLFIV